MKKIKYVRFLATLFRKHVVAVRIAHGPLQISLLVSLILLRLLLLLLLLLATVLTP